MSKPYLAVGLSVVVLMLTQGGQAMASCALNEIRAEPMPDGDGIEIYPMEDVCNGGGVLLRQNVDTGEVVVWKHICGPGDTLSAIADTCVPAGTYRYGPESPLLCGCDTRIRFAEVTVETPIEACNDDSAPEPYTGLVPWGDEPQEQCFSSGGCSTAGSPANRGELSFFGLMGLVGLAVMMRRRKRY